MRNPSSDYAFIDLETTGLDPDRHEVWEVAAIRGPLVLHAMWQPNLATAELQAVEVNGVLQRQLPVFDDEAHRQTALKFARFLAGATLVGASVHFDATFLGRYLRDHGMLATWHYRLLDVSTFYAGAVGWPGPRGLTATADDLVVDVDRDEQHTALYDAWLARQVWEATWTTQLGKDTPDGWPELRYEPATDKRGARVVSA